MKKNLNYIYICILLLVIISVAFAKLPQLTPISKAATTHYSVTDSTGQVLQFERKPERILSLSLSTDEILLDLVDKDRIVGLSQWSDVPAIANNYAKARNIKHKLRSSNIEQIIALQPDLVVVTSFFSEELLDFMRGLGLKVYVYPTLTTIDDIKSSIHALGKAVGEPERADQITQGMDKKLDFVAAKLQNIPNKNKTVIHMEGDLAYYSPDISFNDICRYAGAKNINQKLESKQVRFLSKEEILSLNPDVFIVTDWDFDGNNNPQKMIDIIKSDPAYSTLDAVKQNRIYAIKGRHLLTTSHYIVNGVEDLANAVYKIKDQK